MRQDLRRSTDNATGPRAEARSLAIAALAAACLFLACGSKDPTPHLPDLPQLALESFPEAERTQLRTLLDGAKAAPSDAEANGALGRALHANEQYQAAETLYQRAAALDPGALRWPYYLGVVRSSQGKYAEAADALETASAIDPAFAPAKRRLAETRLYLNEPEAAASLFEGLLRDSPNDPGALFGLGRALAAQGDPAGAIGAFEKAVDAAPEYAAAHYELALAYRDQGEDELSSRHLSLYEGNKQGPAPPADDPLMAAVDGMKRGAGDRVARGIALAQEGDIEGAIAEHLAALETDPLLAQAHVNLVQLYGRSGNVDKALEHYRAAAELVPGQADLHYNLGVLLFERGRLPEAKKAFERAVGSNPGYAAAHNNLGQIAESEGRLDVATAHYRRALEAQPNFRLARFHLGRMLLAQRSPREAAVHLQRALEPRDEMTPHVLVGLATARVQLGDPESARKLGVEARELAKQTGQTELARKIDADLAALR